MLAGQLNEILAGFQAKLVEVMEQQIKAMTASTFTQARPTAAEQPGPSQAKASKPPRRFSKKDSPKRNEERAQPLDAARRLNWSRALNTARWQPRRELSAPQETGIPFSDAREYLQAKKAARKAESVEDEYSDTGSTPIMMDPPLTYNSQRHSSLREMAGQTSRTHPDRAVEQNKPSRHTAHENQAPLAQVQEKVATMTLDWSTPFAPGIMATPRPSKIKLPSIEAFDGTTDPNDHISAYKHQMYVQAADDATWCKLFPATLKGVAQKWFNSLPAHCINNFTELSTLFAHHFMANKQEKETSMHLGKVQQGDKESLRSYVKRFNLEVLSTTSSEGYGPAHSSLT